MSDQQYYRILLDDYSAASFTSFDKAYFGTILPILRKRPLSGKRSGSCGADGPHQ